MDDLPLLFWLMGKHASGMTYDAKPPYAKGSTDCVRWAFAWMREYYGEELDAFSDELHINDPNIWSNIAALLELGHTEVDQPRPGKLHYCQGWNFDAEGKPKSGHASVYFAQPLMVDHADLVFQATTHSGPWFVERTWPSHAGRWDRVKLVCLEWR